MFRPSAHFANGFIATATTGLVVTQIRAFANSYAFRRRMFFSLFVFPRSHLHGSSPNIAVNGTANRYRFIGPTRAARYLGRYAASAQTVGQLTHGSTPADGLGSRDPPAISGGKRSDVCLATLCRSSQARRDASSSLFAGISFRSTGKGRPSACQNFGSRLTPFRLRGGCEHGPVGRIGQYHKGSGVGSTPRSFRSL